MYYMNEVINTYILQSLLANIVNNFIKLLLYSYGQFCQHI